MTISFCPHCGTDLRDAAPVAPTIAPAPAPEPSREIVRREVTSKEREDLWGLLPLPFQTVPFGVVTENGAPVALACNGKDGKLWMLAGGKETMLDTSRLTLAAPQPAPAQLQATVPEHMCSLENAAKRRERGGQRYGS